MSKLPVLRVPTPEPIKDEFKRICENYGQTVAGRIRSLMLEDIRRERELARYKKKPPTHF